MTQPLYYTVTFANAITMRPGQHERYEYATYEEALAVARSEHRPFNNTRVSMFAVTYEYPGWGRHGYAINPRTGEREHQ